MQNTPQWSAAQRAFVESMAAYSIVSYLLQVLAPWLYTGCMSSMPAFSRRLSCI